MQALKAMIGILLRGKNLSYNRSFGCIRNWAHAQNVNSNSVDVFWEITLTSLKSISLTVPGGQKLNMRFCLVIFIIISKF